MKVQDITREFLRVEFNDGQFREIENLSLYTNKVREENI